MNLLRTAEVAKRLGVHSNTVLAWIRDGHFPGAYKIGPGKTSPYVIPESAIEAFEARLRGEQAATPVKND